MNDWQRWVVRLAAVVLLGLLAWYVSRAPGKTYTAIKGEAFGTHYRITYANGPGRETVQRAVETKLQRIDAMASTWRDDSELMRYNRSDDPNRFDLSVELSRLIEQAEQIEADTAGAFSPRPQGGAIDLSGIAKGYAVDQIVELLQTEFGITDCLVDIGGEVRTAGDGPNEDGWRIGLYVPRELPGLKAPTLILRDTSVATSGVYFKGDHILDPTTGEPVHHDGLVSASAIHKSNTMADALATAMVVMGPDRGLVWAQDNGVHVTFLLSDGTQLTYEPE